MKKRTNLLWVALLMVISNVSAQIEIPTPSFPSPEATGVGIFGSIPVSQFTGIPDISIPIYELKNKNISVPIALRYHLASVKPNLHPSWVGLGWNLSAGGCITRSVNYFPDELMDGNGKKTGFFGNYSNLNINDDWYSESQIGKFLEILHNDSREVASDEFTFNFCGYSGTFSMDHTGQWIVSSDIPIIVKFNETTDCIKTSEIREDIKHHIGSYMAAIINTRLINQITLITPDGTKYLFGGKNATEYTIPYFQQNTGYLTSTSWFLSKITNREGDSITFDYISGKPICEIKPFYTKLTRSNGSVHVSGCLIRASEECRDARLILPVYLKKISIDKQRYIDFNSSLRNDLQIKAPWLKLTEVSIVKPEDSNIFYIDKILQSRQVFVDGPADLQWRKLNEIAIIDGSANKKFGFDYLESQNKRLRLDGLSEQLANGAGSSILGKYHFDYYHKSTINWPGYFTDQEDHWGFFNGSKDLTNTIDFKNYSSLREPSTDINVRVEEMLSSITYPTGGRTSFIYECNDYSQYVDDTNKLYDYSSSLTTGGVRIKNIIKYDPIGNTGSATSYYYMKNFNLLKDTANTRVSSGILAQKPIYKCNFDVYLNDVKFDNYQMFSSGSIGTSLYNANGSHVGYTQVVEVQKDLSGNVMGYKKYTFTNFGNDSFSSNHLDEAPLYFGGFSDKLFGRYSDKSIERGKLISEDFFSSQNKLMKTINYKYAATPGMNFVRAIKTNEFSIGIFDNVRNIVYSACAYKRYVYSYLPSQKNEKIYGQTEPISQTTDYVYDEMKQLKQQTVDISKEKRLRTDYKYTYDFTNNSAYTQMKYNFMISTPVEITKTLEDKSTNTNIFLQKDKLIYSLFNSLPFLYSYQISRKSETNSTEEYRCERIDKKGNPISVLRKGSPQCIYLWAYEYKYPISEIKNATYDEVVNILGGESIMENIGNNPNYPTLINKLKTSLPNAEITTFSYLLNSQKTQQVDTRGIITNYDYDSNGKLKQITDHDSFILKYFNYGYKNN